MCQVMYCAAVSLAVFACCVINGWCTSESNNEALLTHACCAYVDNGRHHGPCCSPLLVPLVACMIYDIGTREASTFDSIRKSWADSHIFESAVLAHCSS